MTRFINIATILLQVGLTIVTTFTLYMLFAMFDYQGGIANFVGLTLFQPLFALFLSILTVIVCGLFGLSLRLNNRLNKWWRKHFYFSILIGLVGLLFCAMSLTTGFVEETTYRMDGMDMTQTVPNQMLSITGWFLFAFGTLHSYPPKGLQDKIENLVNRELTRKQTKIELKEKTTPQQSV